MVTPDTIGHALGDDEGAYVEHVGGGDREGLAPDHALAVEAPGVDARTAARRRSRSGRGGASPSSTASPATSATSPGPMPPARSGRAACRPSARPSRGRAGAAARGRASPSAARARGAPRARRTGRAAPRAAAGRAPRPRGGRRRTTPTTARASRTERRRRGQRDVCIGLGEPGRRQRPDDGAEHARRGAAPARSDDDHAGDRRGPRRTPWGVRRTPSDRPADGLAERGRGEHPGEHHDLGTEQPVGRRDERGDGEQAPHLDEPGRG